MPGADRPIWFAGDLDDPWVVAIAGALPRPSVRLHCPTDLPDDWPIDLPAPGVVVLHRPTLGATDAHRLTRLIAQFNPAPRVLLCVGPHARHVDVERWARLVDAVLPDATASQTIARHVLGMTERPPGHRPKVAVVSTSFELRSMLLDACRAGGFEAESAVEGAGFATVWDVPVLEPGWPETMARWSASSKVVAMLGFPDRETVSTARDHGASACLELPCEVADLFDALDRLATPRPMDLAHPFPPAPMGMRKSTQHGMPCFRRVGRAVGESHHFR